MRWLVACVLALGCADDPGQAAPEDVAPTTSQAVVCQGAGAAETEAAFAALQGETRAACIQYPGMVQAEQSAQVFLVNGEIRSALSGDVGFHVPRDIDEVQVRIWVGDGPTHAGLDCAATGWPVAQGGCGRACGCPGAWCLEYQLRPQAGTATLTTLVREQVEVFDCADNDCDGSTDEGVSASACESGAAGICGPGTQACGPGGLECQPDIPPGDRIETCNNADDDCDGDLDEGFDVGAGCVEGVGACQARGVVVCDGQGDALCDATPGAPAQESCNQTDDDCDGTIDEGIEGCCVAGTACGVDVGDCTVGMNQCTANGEFVACVDGGGDRVVLPGVEPEVCDDADNDCDGQTDEGFGLGEACDVGVGACFRDGTIVCDGNGGRTCSATPGEPAAETCNGVDDDCDGVEDNVAGLGEGCRVGVGACQRRGVQECRGNALTCSAEPGRASAERCNGLDDDCDGDVDEAFVQLGRQCTVGDGRCEATGRIVCLNDDNVTCDAEENAGAARNETCNDQDDDCDGRTDEGGVCEPPEEQP